VNDGRLAYDPNRLPWLPNDQRPPPPPNPPARRARGERRIPWATAVPWALLALLLVAGLSYWLGMRSMRSEPAVRPPAEQAAPDASITLPPPRERESAAPPAVEEPRIAVPVEAEPVEAEPAEAEPIKAEPPKAAVREAPRKAVEPRAKPAKPKAKATPSKAAPAKAKKPKRATRPARLQAWPADVSQGASGRLVRIGTFTSSRQAKRAWWRLMRTYPGMQRLKAVVVPVRSMRNNRTYYRLQFGTTSHAHSSVLCQRMRMIGQSCVVIGVANRGGATGQ
jgi:hypothetical protein